MEREELLTEVREMNRLLAEQNRLQRDWKLSIRNGILSGLGGVIGATIVAAIVISMLRPALERVGLENLIESGARTSASHDSK